LEILPRGSSLNVYLSFITLISLALAYTPNPESTRSIPFNPTPHSRLPIPYLPLKSEFRASVSVSKNIDTGILIKGGKKKLKKGGGRDTLPSLAVCGSVGDVQE